MVEVLIKEEIRGLTTTARLGPSLSEQVLGTGQFQACFIQDPYRRGNILGVRKSILLPVRHNLRRARTNIQLNN